MRKRVKRSTSFYFFARHQRVPAEQRRLLTPLRQRIRFQALRVSGRLQIRSRWPQLRRHRRVRPALRRVPDSVQWHMHQHPRFLLLRLSSRLPHRQLDLSR